jgi:serine-type D-Ala-D-Ala carboxypeptidase
MRTLLIALSMAGMVAACDPTTGGEGPVGVADPLMTAVLALADSVMEDAVASEILPGGVLLVARGGVVLHEKAYGFAKLYEGGRRLEKPEPMTVAHLFDLASVTKVMATTWALMLLVDRGLLELDAPVHTYLPDFRGSDKDRITVRDLLTHRSGLHRWKPVYYHAGSPQEAYSFIRDLPLESEVQADRRYSDLGFMLAGYIVEAVSGRPLDQFLHQELYGPLGLAHTGFMPALGFPGRGGGTPSGLLGATSPGRGGGTPPGPLGATFPGRPEGAFSASPGKGPRGGEGSPLPAPFAATSHGNPYEKRMVEDDSFGYLCDEDPDAFTGWRTHTLQGEVNDGNAWYAHQGVAGHAGLFSTASDLGVILGVLLEGGRHGSRRMVSEGVVEQFLTPDTLTGNGVGWAMSIMGPEGGGDSGAGSPPGIQIFSHGGFTGTYVLGAPELGLAVVVLSNRQNVGVDQDGLYPDAAGVYLPVVRRIVEAAASRDPDHPRGRE